MASSVFSSTLQAVTTTKLNELSKKRNIYENQKFTALNKARAEHDDQKRLALLIDGVKSVSQSEHKRKEEGIVVAVMVESRMVVPRTPVLKYILEM